MSKSSCLVLLLALSLPSAGNASDAYFRVMGGPAPAIITFDMAGCRLTGENIAFAGYRMDPALPPGAQTMLIGRADDAGVPIWTQSVDIPGADYGHSIIETANTDLATGGYTMDPATGLFDMMLTRFTRAGAPVYVRTVGVPGFDDYAFSLAEDPSDGGMVVTGWSNGFTPNYAATLFKMTPAGAMAWGFTYGGAAGPAFADRGTYVTRMSDGSFIVTGWTKTFAAAGAAQDLLLMRVTPAGVISWSRSLGFGGAPGPVTETEGRCVVEAPDGGILVVGLTGVTGFPATRDMLVAKFTPGGGLIWAETVGGPGEDFGYGVTVTDAGFAVCGHSSQPPNADQAIVIGFDGLGAMLWNRAIGLGGFEEFRSVETAGDGRLFLTGRSAAFGPAVTNLIYGAVDPNGAGCIGGPVPLVVATPAAINAPLPVVSAAYPAPIAPAPSTILPLLPATPLCSQPSALTTYVNAYDEVTTPAQVQADAIAQGIGTAGAVAGSITAGATPSWAIMRFDPFGAMRWTKSYGTNPGTSVEMGRGIARTLQGWWSVALTLADFTSPRYPLLMKLDDNGLVMIQRRIGGTAAEPMGIASTSDGGAAVVGFTVPGPGNNSRAFLSKFTSAGTHQWTSALSAVNHETRGWAVMQVADGGYVLAGSDQDIMGGFQALLIAKLNAAGALVWSRALQLGTAHFDVGTAVAQTAAGNYAVAGYDSDNNTGELSALIAEFNPAGVLQWQTQMSGPDLERVTGLFARGDSLVVSGRSTVYAPGSQLTLAKTNPAGDVLWLRALYEPGSLAADAVAVSNGGDILAAGDANIASSNGILVGKFNARGLSCLGVGYTPFFTHPPDTFYDPGLASALEARTITSPLILDSDETLTLANCPAPLVVVEDPDWRTKMRGVLDLDVVSPASRDIECRITTAHAATVRLSVFDLSGRRVGSSIALGELSAGPHVVHVPLNGLARGVYTIVADGTTASARAKFIFLRD
jgi:hypothetical protein